ncbi:MAG: hypothetical protein P1U36_09355 [Legionellaceae bacterium]|nr:hypothetical protein [Legionellaceae bacterium]
MLKSLFVVVFGLLPISLTFATPLQHLMHVEKPLHSSKNELLSQSALSTQNYADFTGIWSGMCHADGEAQGGWEGVLDIKNDQGWIQLCDQGRCDDYAIGKNISTREVQGESFFVEHHIFSWSSITSLSFNFVAISDDVVSSGKHAVSSISGRSTFTLKDGKLSIQHEVFEFDYAEEANQSKFICELVRQPGA